MCVNCMHVYQNVLQKKSEREKDRESERDKEEGATQRIEGVNLS